LRAVASLHALPRVGIVVPKYKHSSVERNRLKRQLRELLRLELLPALAALTPPLDVLVRASPSAYARGFDGLGRELAAAERQLRKLAPSLALSLAPTASPSRTDPGSAAAPAPVVPEPTPDPESPSAT
jgi:ribonuclease P protein component